MEFPGRGETSDIPGLPSGVLHEDGRGRTCTFYKRTGEKGLICSTQGQEGKDFHIQHKEEKDFHTRKRKAV